MRNQLLQHLGDGTVAMIEPVVPQGAAAEVRATMGALDRSQLVSRAGQMSAQATLLQREAVLQQWAVTLASHIQEHATAQEQLERNQEEVIGLSAPE
jgi:hypothetical protein